MDFFSKLLEQYGGFVFVAINHSYMHNYLHESLATAGLVLFFMSCAMILGNYLGGWLFDHWSPYQTALTSVSIATAAVIALIFFP